MPRKGMRSFCFSPKSSSSFSFSHHPSPGGGRGGGGSFSPMSSYSDSVVDTTITAAEAFIEKWNPDSSTFAKVTSLFYENKREAKDFIKCVYDLNKAMHYAITEDSASEKLVRAQTLMAVAMKRLQKEFYQILSVNRAHLDPESVSARSSHLSCSTWSSTSDFDQEDDREDEIRNANESEIDDVSAVAMADLKTIAECMIASGYGKDCVKIYKIIRKSIVDEGIYKLRVEKIGSANIHKMDWEVLEMRISSWLSAVKVSVDTLFNGERILCDHVFASSENIRESCFTEITREGASTLFGFAENVAKNAKKTPEKVFRLLDMYTAIAKNWPEIDSIFSFESTFAVRSQAVNSLIKLGETVRLILSEFEASILKDSNKSRVPGAGVHLLTLHVMNYLSILGDYSSVLADIFADEPPPSKSSLPESYFSLTDPDESPAPPITLRIARLILVLLCKLDGKAKHYKDVSISYLFLANNLQHIITKVRTSNLKYLLGDDWLSKQENKVKQFAANYVRLGWRHVIEALPSDSSSTAMSPEEAKDCFKRFNSAFEQAYLKQSVCVVPDNRLRDEMKVSIAQKIVPTYGEFYRRHRSVMVRERNYAPMVRYAPEDVGNQLSDLFFGPGSSDTPGDTNSSPSWSHHSRPSPSPSR